MLRFPLSDCTALNTQLKNCFPSISQSWRPPSVVQAAVPCLHTVLYHLLLSCLPTTSLSTSSGKKHYLVTLSQKPCMQELLSDCQMRGGIMPSGLLESSSCDRNHRVGVPRALGIDSHSQRTGEELLIPRTPTCVRNDQEMLDRKPNRFFQGHFGGRSSWQRWTLSKVLQIPFLSPAEIIMVPRY